MTKENLTEVILKQSVENVRNTLPSIADYSLGTFGGVFLSFKDAYESLENHFKEKAAIDNDSNVPRDVRDISRAAMFTTSVVSGLYMTERVKNNIDKFFENPENNQYFEDLSNEEKAAFSQELKNKVEESFKPQTVTPQGKAYVQTITDKFNSEIERAKAHHSENAEKYLLAREISVINRMFNELKDNDNVAEAIGKVKDNIQNADSYFKNQGVELDRSFDYKIIDSMYENASQLSYENNGCINHAAFDFTIDLDSEDDEYMLKILYNFDLDEYDSTRLFQWADRVMSKYPESKINQTMVNGKPLFTDDEKEDLPRGKKKARVLASILKGDKVTYWSKNNDYEFVYRPEIKDNREKTFLEKIIDFFNNLLKLDDLSKMKSGIIKATNSHFTDKSNIREKMSFEEISGVNNLKKMSSPEKKSAEKSTDLSI